MREKGKYRDSNYDDNTHKLLLMNTLRDDLGLSKLEILDFLLISDSTYNKMVSSDGRKLPKRSQRFLEEIFHEKNWDKMIEVIKKNESFIKRVAKTNHRRFNHDFKSTMGAFFLIDTLFDNKNVGGLISNDLDNLVKVFENENFGNILKRYIRLNEFSRSGDICFLKEEDYVYLGFFYAVKNDDEIKNSLYNLGRQRAKIIEENHKNSIG